MTKKNRVMSHSFMKKAVATAATVAMTASMCVAVPAAGAATGVNTVKASEAVTASVTPASQTAVQMLGMSCIEDPTSKGDVTAENWWGSGASGGTLKYLIDGNTSISASVDPYVVNTLTGGTPSNVFYATHIGAGSFNTGIAQPKSALAEIGENESADQVWKQLPDVLVGNWVSKTGDQTTYRDEANNSVNIINGKASKEGVESFGNGNYDPQVVDYQSDTMHTIISSTYDIAEAAKKVVTQSNGAKKLRFGDANSALDIATTYEEFIKGSQGYVLYRLNQDKKTKKTVAVINSVEDTEAGPVFKLMQTLESDTSAKEDRAIESLKNVCNIMTGDANHQATVADLAAADMILVGVTVKDQSNIVDKIPEYKNKTYWISSDKTSSQGTTYDINRNNTEIGQNYARLIACAYPEYLDQSDMVAFWYDKFLHVKSSQLGTVISRAMSGTRNWDNQNDYTTWTTSTIKGYKAANVQAKIETGCAYLCTWSDSKFTGAAELLKPTNYITKLKLKVPTAAKATSISSLKGASKSFTVKYKKVSAASKYQVMYSTSKNFKKSTTKTTTSTSLKVKNLKKGTYYVKVRTVKMNGADPLYSKWSTAKKVTVTK